MLKFGLNVARRAPGRAAAVRSRGLAAAAAAATAAERAKHILGLSAEPAAPEPTLFFQQKEFLRQLQREEARSKAANSSSSNSSAGSAAPAAAAPSAGAAASAHLDLAFEVYNKVHALSRAVDRSACAQLSLLCLNEGQPARGLEAWASFLESLGARLPRAALESRLNGPEFEPAALAALACYFVLAGPAADAETAERLVPRHDVPSNLSVLKNLGGIASPDAQQITLRGLAQLRRHRTQGWTAPAFLERVARAPFAELNNLWRQIELVTPPAEIPEAAYAAFIRRMAETRQSHRAFALWQQLVDSGAGVSPRGWAALLRAALCAPKNADALFRGIWAKMVAQGFAPDAACNTERLLCLTRHGRLDDALAFFKELQAQQQATAEPRRRAPAIEVSGLNILLSALARAKRFDEADAALQWAAAHGVVPNEWSYNALIAGAGGADLEAGARYLREMIARGIQPTVVTYTFAMQQLLRRGQPIADLLAEMAAAGIEPNERFNTTLAYHLGRRTQDLSLARATMEGILERKVRVGFETLGAFIELELRHGDVDRAVKYLDLQRRFGLTPSRPTYNQVLKGALARGRPDVARRLFEYMATGPELRLRPNAYTFQFMLKWPLQDLQKSTAARELVRLAAAHIDPRFELDFPLAKRIEEIANLTGTELVSAELRERAAQTVLELYDRRLASSA